MRRYLVSYVDMSIITCTNDDAYASRLALIVRNGSYLVDAALATHSLEYVAFPRHFASLHLLTNFE